MVNVLFLLYDLELHKLLLVLRVVRGRPQHVDR
jgi:hypothetical protein